MLQCDLKSTVKTPIAQDSDFRSWDSTFDGSQNISGYDLISLFVAGNKGSSIDSKQENV